MSMSTGQKVTVNEASSTTYQKGTSSTSASAIATGEGVLVLGMTSGTTSRPRKSSCNRLGAADPRLPRRQG